MALKKIETAEFEPEKYILKQRKLYQNWAAKLGFTIIFEETDFDGIQGRSAHPAEGNLYAAI